ncbi:BBSome complex member BBS1-like [Convolutriloba macropyga]|uniref:BBSome complex member BBS1-like n=1 Tax=Convolutriloba macropyga TaxID=536237 RepID=UPI003F5228CC
MIMAASGTAPVSNSSMKGTQSPVTVSGGGGSGASNSQQVLDSAKILSEKEDKLKRETNAKFLTAFNDPVAQIHTFSSCIALADLTRDGDYKLILADFGKLDLAAEESSGVSVKLKVFQGTQMKMENQILDFPTGICALYIDNNMPRTPAIAVASGQSVYVYKNMRPFYKYTLPPLPVSQLEQHYWNLTRDEMAGKGQISASELRDRLEALRLDPTLHNNSAATNGGSASSGGQETNTALPLSTKSQKLYYNQEMAGKGQISASELRDRLEALRLDPTLHNNSAATNGGSASSGGQETNTALPLSTKSQKLIMMTNAEAMANFVNLHKVSPLTRQNVLTCLTSLKKSQTEEEAVSCVVLGLESKQILILDTQTFTPLTTFPVPAVPVSVDAAGEYDVNYRITILCRDARVYAAKKPKSWESAEVKLWTELSSQAVGLVRTGKFFMIACMDHTLNCYTPKGKKAWAITAPGAILATELMEHKSRGFQAVLVALDNRQIRIYREKFLVGILDTGEHNVVAMRFGQFGREEGALITVNSNGALKVQLLRRVAKFNEREVVGGAPPEQNVRLNIPKKTKLYVDQTTREKEHSAEIYRAFQRDLVKLKLTVAQNYRKALDKALTPMSHSSVDGPIGSAHGDTQASVKLSAQVQGIGPTFKLILGIQNTSSGGNGTLQDLFVLFRYDHSLYDVKQKLIQPGLLVPGLDYKFETFVQCLSQQPVSGDIEILVGKKGNPNPLVVNVIQMPISEGNLF